MNADQSTTLAVRTAHACFRDEVTLAGGLQKRT
jgi:hypothetical protein